jgi:hypothetical protein
MICSGVGRRRFIESSCPAGRSDSHTSWTNLRGSGQACSTHFVGRDDSYVTARPAAARQADYHSAPNTACWIRRGDG